MFVCRWPDAAFVRNPHRTTAEDASPKICAIMWLTWTTNKTAVYTRGFIDKFKSITRGQPSVDTHPIAGLPTTIFGREASDKSAAVSDLNQQRQQTALDQKLPYPQNCAAENNIPISENHLNVQRGIGNLPFPFMSTTNDPGKPRFGNPADDLKRLVDHSGNVSRVPLFGNTGRRIDDNETRRISYFQGTISKGHNFRGELSQSAHRTLQMYELTAR